MTELIRLVSTAALVISSSWALALIVKASLALVAALIVARLCVRQRAALRHLLFAATFGALLALPLVAAVAPATIVELPVARSAAPSIAGPTEADSISDDHALAMPGSLHGADAPSALSMRQLLMSAWLLGVVLFSAPMALGLFQLRRLCRRSRTWLDGQSVVDTIIAKTGRRTRVVLLQHAAVPGPLTCGLLTPTILVPSDAANWNEHALQRALVHEVEHVRRKDWMTHCVARAVCALYWFHPLVWVAWRQLRLEAERSCDDAVVGQEDAREYASLLITCAQRQVSEAGLPILAMATRGDLSVRVAALLNRRQRRGGVTGSCVAVAIVVAMIASWAMGTVMFAQPTAAAAIAQSPKLSFEVVSIKRNISGEQDIVVNAPNGTAYNTMNVALLGTLMRAYQVKNVAGAPDWVESERYDITAKAAGKPTFDEVTGMLRTMLTERTKLKAHIEPREMPVYALVVATPNHPGLRRFAQDCSAVLAGRDAAMKAGQPLPPPGANGALPCAFTWAAAINSGGITMARLAGLLDWVAGRVVLDRTGLSGPYEFTLSFASPYVGAAPDDRPNLFTALPEQLGLKLEPTRAPIDTLVIDYIERPSEN